MSPRKHAESPPAAEPVQSAAFGVSAPRCKGERSEGDFYRTPDWCTERLLNRWVPTIKGEHPKRILDPAAGDGAILDWLAGTFPKATIEASDMSPRRGDIPTRIFPWWREPEAVYDLVMTNPPFDQALEFVEQALGLVRPGGYVVMFLRAAFLASAKRAPFLERSMPERVYFLSERPSFYGGGNDLSDYAWFVWRVGRRGSTFTGEII